MLNQFEKIALGFFAVGVLALGLLAIQGLSLVSPFTDSPAQVNLPLKTE